MALWLILLYSSCKLSCKVHKEGRNDFWVLGQICDHQLHLKKHQVQTKIVCSVVGQ